MNWPCVLGAVVELLIIPIKLIVNGLIQREALLMFSHINVDNNINTFVLY